MIHLLSLASPPLSLPSPLLPSPPSFLFAPLSFLSYPTLFSPSSPSPPLPPLLPLPQGADLTLPDFSGVSPFLLAVQENATQCVAVAMNYCPKEMLESVDQEGRSPLLYAIHSGSVEMCRQLLELGASAETPDQVRMGERGGVRVGGGVWVRRVEGNRSGKRSTVSESIVYEVYCV